MASPNPRTVSGSYMKKNGLKERMQYIPTMTGSGARYSDQVSTMSPREDYLSNRPPNRADTPESKRLQKK